jgi:hypothetical protein
MKYLVSLIDSGNGFRKDLEDGTVIYKESSSKLFKTVGSAIEYAHKAYRKQFNSYDFEEGVDEFDCPRLEFDEFVERMKQTGQVVINASDSHFTVELSVLEDEDPAEDARAVERIKSVYEASDRDTSAEVMAGLLMDDNWSSYKMFEGMCSDYINGNADVRKGIDLSTSAMTGYNLLSIAEKVEEAMKRG